MRGDVTEQETLLLRLYKQLSQRKAELEQIRYFVVTQYSKV